MIGSGRVKKGGYHYLTKHQDFMIPGDREGGLGKEDVLNGVLVSRSDVWEYYVKDEGEGTCGHWHLCEFPYLKKYHIEGLLPSEFKSCQDMRRA